MSLLSASVTACSLSATSCQLFLLQSFICVPHLFLFLFLWRLYLISPNPHTHPLLSSLCLLIVFCQEPSEVLPIFSSAIYFSFSFLFTLLFRCAQTIKGLPCDCILLDCFYAADQGDTACHAPSKEKKYTL